MMIRNQQRLTSDNSKDTEMSSKTMTYSANHVQCAQDKLLLQEHAVVDIESFALNKDKYKDTIVRNAVRSYYETEINNIGSHINIKLVVSMWGTSFVSIIVPQFALVKIGFL